MVDAGVSGTMMDLCNKPTGVLLNSSGKWLQSLDPVDTEANCVFVTSYRGPMVNKTKSDIRSLGA